MGIDGHQALALELPQGFAHRNSAQAELRGQLILAQRLAALEHAAHNGVAQHIRDHARRRAPAADSLGIELTDTHGGIIYWIQCLSKDLPGASGSGADVPVWRLGPSLSTRRSSQSMTAGATALPRQPV